MFLILKMSNFQYIQSFPIFILDNENNCSICNKMMSKGNHIKKAPCKHYFHADCFDQYFETQDKCAECNYSIIFHDGCHGGRFGSPCFFGNCKKCYNY